MPVSMDRTVDGVVLDLFMALDVVALGPDGVSKRFTFDQLLGLCAVLGIPKGRISSKLDLGYKLCWHKLVSELEDKRGE